MELNLNVELVGLDRELLLDKQSKPINLGRWIANQISTAKTEQPMKVWSWAQKLYDGLPITLDGDDKKFFEKLIKEHTELPNFAAAVLWERLG